MAVPGTESGNATVPPQGGDITTEVVVLGGGLAGLTMAAALASAGVPVVCIDQDSPERMGGQEFDIRTTAISYASKMVLEAAGVWHHMADQAGPMLDIRIADQFSPLFIHYDHTELAMEGKHQPFGWILDNKDIRRALFTRAAELPGLVHLAPAKAVTVERTRSGVTVRLADGRTVRGRLLVGADGRRSMARESAGIKVRRWSYDQSAIICTIRHTEPNKGVAVEHFLPNGPFAVLPIFLSLEKLPRTEMQRQIHEFVSEKTRNERLALNVAELDALVDDIVDEMVGLGPLEPLLKDPTINDILINGHDNCFVERRGKLEKIHVPFKDEAHLLRIVNKIVAAVGRRVDESQPMVDARMLDGSRFNAAIRPVGVDGPLVSIRKFSKHKLELHKLIEFGAITQNMAEVLAAAVHARKTTIISGGTGTGKTTMLNALSAFIPEDERLITIEDAAELQLQQPHVARMETRPANVEGHGEIKQRDLVKNALRMRPDRVILGECRGEEAFDMLQAMNTGHEGSMATIHANTPRDAVSRLEQMLGMTGMPMTVQSIRSQISSAIDIIVQLTRLSAGKRKVTSVAEVTGMEGDVIQMQEIFRFVRTGMEADGTINGHFEATGIRPKFMAELHDRGIDLAPELFRPDGEL